MKATKMMLAAMALAGLTAMAAPEYVTVDLEGETIEVAPGEWAFTAKKGECLTIRNAVIRPAAGGAKAQPNGGAVLVDGGTVVLDSGTVIMGFDTKDVAAAYPGGPVWLASGELVIQGDCAITNNTAKKGGAVYMTGGKFTMQGGLLQDNRAVWGGAVCQSAGEFVMDAGGIYDNEAVQGGGVAVLGGTMEITSADVGISYNAAAGYGGGIFVQDAAGAGLSLKGGYVTNNSSGLGAGGVELYQGKVTVSGGQITWNSGKKSAYENNKAAGGPGNVFVLTGGRIGQEPEPGDMPAGTCAVHGIEWGFDKWDVQEGYKVMYATAYDTAPAINGLALNGSSWGTGKTIPASYLPELYDDVYTNTGWTNQVTGVEIEGGVTKATCDVTLGAIWRKVVAKVGSTYYEILGEALDAVPAGGKVEIIKECPISSYMDLRTSQSYSLDLTGGLVVVGEPGSPL